MQFQVPQFIETEDKIIGPLTLKQFGYIAGGGFTIFLLYFLLAFPVWIILATLIAIIVAAMAFIKYNGRPFIVLAFAMFNYFWQPRFYLWQSPQVSGTAAKKPTKEDFIGGGLSLLGLKINTFTKPMPDRKERGGPSFLDRWRGTKEKFEVFRKLTGERDVARRVDYR